MLAFIWAEDALGGIGHAGGLPWGEPIPADMQWFRRWTLGKTIAMGRRTWQSLGARPLPGRHNLVVSRTLAEAQGAEIVRDVQDILARAQREEVFVIGGASLFAALGDASARLVRTRIEAEFPADTWFPFDPEASGYACTSSERLAPGEKTPWPLVLEVWERRASG